MRPRSAARRGAILDAAFALIVERGFEGLRLRDVADAAGINSATLVYYFADKEELIAAVVRRIVERLRGLNEERGVVMTRPDGLATHIAAIRDDVVASPATYIALCEVAVRARRHPKIAAAMDARAAHAVRHGVSACARARRLSVGFHDDHVLLGIDLARQRRRVVRCAHASQRERDAREVRAAKRDRRVRRAREREGYSARTGLISPKRPLRKSSNAAWISSIEFITNGP